MLYCCYSAQEIQKPRQRQIPQTSERQKIMRCGYIETNENALAALKNEDFGKAQELFRANAKHYPNGCTLNNLGVFYCYCGIRQKTANR